MDAELSPEDEKNLTLLHAIRVQLVAMERRIEVMRQSLESCPRSEAMDALPVFERLLKDIVKARSVLIADLPPAKQMGLTGPSAHLLQAQEKIAGWKGQRNG